MVTQVKETQHLYEELQLGNKLNECVHRGERSEFALLLSMLDQDVQQHSQFSLPKTEKRVKEIDNETLRKSFNLPKQQALALSSVDEINEFNNASLVEQGSIDTIRLKSCLNPQALSFRDDKKHIDTTIVNSLSLHCRHRLNQKQLNEQPTKRLPFDAANWLSGIRDTLVSSALV